MQATTRPPRLTRFLEVLPKLLGGALLVSLILVGYIFLESPSAIRHPRFEHAHFRMQVIVNGKAENFAGSNYQTPYESNQCSDDISKEPIHFHDNRDQFVHIHWKDITGGMVLKYYGWNYIGGLSNALGYRFDTVQSLVPTHGQILPDLPKGTKLFVYSGSAEKFEARPLRAFLDQSLEQFFGTPSNVQPEQTSFLDLFTKKAYAHADSSTPHSEEELTRINNLLGNVVIFVQPMQPTNAEVKARFAQLLPLNDSTCGG